MLSPLKQRSKVKPITVKDYDLIKHYFITFYGYQMWKEIPLNEFFEMLPTLFKEVSKKETLRLSTLKYYGVKNPK